MEEEIYYQMEAASGRTVRVPASQLKDWMEGQADIERGEQSHLSDESTEEVSRLLGIPISMRELRENSCEERELFKIVNTIGDSIRTDLETLMTVIVLIDTRKKLENFKQWVDSVTVNGMVQTNEAELLNKVSEISRSAQ